MQDTISIKGAREHNLKNVDIELPRGKLVVITGLSGSGKSSLAFDTIGTVRQPVSQIADRKGLWIFFFVRSMNPSRRFLFCS